MQTGVIYKAANKINNKTYIGQTIQKLESRINQHYNKAIKRTNKFANALRKYSKNNWMWKIIHDNIPRKYLNDMEIFYIFLFDTYNYGYNSTKGGETSSMSNPEVAKKMSERMMGKGNHMYGRKGIDNPTYGIKFSEERKRKISQAHSGKKTIRIYEKEKVQSIKK